MSRAKRFDEGDFAARQQASVLTRVASSNLLLMPIAVLRKGDTVMADRDGKGTPHHGVDLYAPGGTEVRAALGGRVRLVVDGRRSAEKGRRRAGLWVDVLADNGTLHRYLHLNDTLPAIKPNARILRGARIGSIAHAHQSGLGNDPHLHFEIRLVDERKPGGYGHSLDPLKWLPA